MKDKVSGGNKGYGQAANLQGCKRRPLAKICITVHPTLKIDLPLQEYFWLGSVKINKIGASLKDEVKIFWNGALGTVI